MSKRSRGSRKRRAGKSRRSKNTEGKNVVNIFINGNHNHLNIDGAGITVVENQIPSDRKVTAKQKSLFLEGLKKLGKFGIAVFPYIKFIVTTLLAYGNNIDK